MKAVVFSYTRRGARLSLSVGTGLEELGYEVTLYTSAKFVGEASTLQLSAGCKQDAKQAFATSSVIIYIGACGIAVRAIAPHIINKTVDPAVLSIDEGGHYVIPLLAGHIGGANAVARKLAEVLEAEPVVTTATDINGLFAVDEWAAKNKIHLDDLTAAKAFAAALVDGKSVGVVSEYPISGTLPQGLVLATTGEVGLVLAPQAKFKPFTVTLNLIPASFYLGIGCRRHTPLAAIEELVLPQLESLGLSMQAVAAVCSVDLKQDEVGLLAFAAKYQVPAHFYTAAALAAQPGEFAHSDLVQSVVGVDNVCERAAVLGAQGKLCLKKTSKNGVTLAIAERKTVIDFHKL
ncbi:MAG: cobalamin biosynthesis protein [Acidaminococcaceae bacterium]